MIAGGLGGCQQRWANRYGPNPAVASADVKEVAERHTLILDYLATAAIGGSAPSASISTVVYSQDWYEVALYGFNFVDEKCDAYLWNLFILERERGRIKNGLTLLDKTTNAILTAADASQLSISVVAQAFGFGQGITDIVAGSYLFSITPSIISQNVKDAQFAYRTEAARNSGAITSRATAYGLIRGYLALCFPHSIEARIERNLAQTTGAPAAPQKPERRAVGFESAAASSRPVEVPPLILTVPERAPLE
jgi:hypothetical protein